ncbi:MAG: Aspartyl/glutamyl-tRNA(Asn/Gln) amidotransferase subunit C [Microgenomates group bacterium GW2011_GWF2_45_18]|nr:MAG: Aspartyl/glutamyl-tRNA(Asn/Gln) amidotransferase subunit C [Microgenomates group bacterium GW2011_GWF1_44_10]KKU01555.1 MAG: Aspartyl/glutamyl-tRNA(Asn/Gln) amidotransferase subunit C [Microgenomates group bacterium GW2011_GWF2_45_18]OGJ41620.1 MAG: hypothetical protein A2378_01260 [Candidatus Pacebacteria bacterium RIFOXYB1_FULL_44_10]HAU99464.1 Asp-tRNA(Asn)/Glu-tRNA(Gln) amidotransferase GatCAB subunit C [Candidatus Paceibacterota bacterium]HAX01530.1 Asp-tRNA(Asn)/Glu-tRNA(Gln) amid
MNSHALDEKMVETLGSMAKIPLTVAQKKRFASTLSTIVQYMNNLRSLDLSSIHSETRPTDLENIFREDVIEPSLSQAEALAHAMSEDGYILAPYVFGGDDA